MKKDRYGKEIKMKLAASCLKLSEQVKTQWLVSQMLLLIKTPGQ